MLSRRISVWLVSFLAVLMIYFVYNRLSRTPPIPISGVRPQIGTMPDVCDINAKVGMVGDVGIGVAKNARYEWLDAQKQKRVFGFEELLHQDGNDWELEKPYYTIYRPDFKCTISGRRARVSVDVAGGQVTPRQGILTGNVKIEILPQRKGGPGEGVVYLDDVVFVADRSALSSAGQVEFVSQDAQLVGKGMELVFGGDAGQIELLKLEKLQSLHIKRQKAGITAGADGGQGPEGEKTGKPLRQAQGRRGRLYKCVLDSNVVIETAGQRLLGDVVTITDIFIAGAEPNTSAELSPSDQNQPKELTRTIVQEDANLAGGDIAISCDGSVVISPMDSVGGQKTEGPASPLATPKQAVDEEAARGGKTLFRGQKVTYSVATSEAVAEGQSRIVFDVNGKDSAGASDGESVSATVSMTAHKRAVFSPESNEVIFEGACRGTISQPIRLSALSSTMAIEGRQPDGNAIQQYIVLGDKLEIDLKQKEGSVGRSSPDIEHLIATGDVVHFASTKKIGERLLSGVELKCARLDYLAEDDNYIATGPGLIKVDNSQTDEPQKGLGRFSLRRKCYAFLRQFDVLKFDGALNHLVADRNGGSMLVDYFPLTESGADNVAVTASHVEADILETAGGRMEVSAFVAKGAVTYEDKDKQFAGGVFIYDSNSGFINVYGDKFRPCLFNGAIVDTVQYDLKTNRANTKIKGPGAIK